MINPVSLIQWEYRVQEKTCVNMTIRLFICMHSDVASRLHFDYLKHPVFG